MVSLKDLQMAPSATVMVLPSTSVMSSQVLSQGFRIEIVILSLIFSRTEALCLL